ncbi:hypothetical protein DFR58_1344 [Anaerobacterium chartisolvens]|uniref:Uncharacterized protein n=1 Tax=Anaerobacterium chartisolvens TaxID=1297424 RepID=A0A369AJQ9_9FIRM|nr:Tad domain-containing protein [Anaerobacterium chartisolvens]RCX09600.1 hypothetical protein DFR58_1344 [Anaerobacterium chartisolvens]
MGVFGSNRGAITVFQCIILMALLIFSGVMVDVCRIAVAERRVHSSLNSASRSVLAGYSPELAGDYGIFALNAYQGADAAKQELIKYLSVNLKENHKNFKFIDYAIEENKTDVHARNNLADSDDNALREEILKYMKYRTPIAVTETVIKKFNMSGIFDKKDSARSEESVRKEFKEWEKSIESEGDETEDSPASEQDFEAWEEEPPSADEDSITKLNDLEKVLGEFLGLKSINEAWLIDFDEVRKIMGIRDIEMGDLRKGVIQYSEDSAELAEKDSENILAFLDNVKNAMEAGTENIYVTEYIMDRFTYHSSSVRRDHFFEKGEVEYILWGDRRENLNISNTVAAIGFLRFAINSVDYFATSKIPHPIFRLVYAIARGMVRAGTDCYELYKGGSIDICPSLKNSFITLDYADHLRVFLLLQAAMDRDGQLNRVRQLMQVNCKRPGTDYVLQNPDFELSDYSTSIHCRAVVKINLWFLPLLQTDKLGIKGFEGGKYVIEKDFYAAY